jgi:nitrite reductase/ring-hydroxylating ferredoxin subunit
MDQVTAPPQPAALRPGDSVCASDCLREGSSGVRFLVEHNGRIDPAFAVRHGARVFAYLNRCAHKLVELDWQEGEFFDAEHRYIMCATHGALYDPATGACVGGPCRGATLTVVPIHEADGMAWLSDRTAVVAK